MSRLLLESIAVFLWVVILFLQSPLIPKNGGLGNDGSKYGRWAMDFPGTIQSGKLDRYLAKRILPSAVVYYSLKALSLPSTHRMVIAAFKVINVLIILLCAALLLSIGRHFHWPPNLRCLGLVLLILNFGVSNHFFFYPVLTDAWGLLLGMLTVYFLVIPRPWGHLAVLILGAFCWPSQPIVSAILFALRTKGTYPKRNHYWIPVAIGVALIALCTLSFVFLRPRIQYHRWAWGPDFWLPVSIFLVGCQGFLLSSSFPAVLRNLHFISWIQPKRLALAVALLACFEVAYHQIATGQGPGLTMLILHLSLVSIGRPLVNLVAHFTYYGMMLPLLLFFWRDIAAELKHHGIGTMVAIGFGGFMMLNPSSRMSINFFPIFVVLLLMALSRYRFSHLVLFQITCANFLLSKVWLRWDLSAFSGPSNGFPRQLYWLNSGPWMSNEMYLVGLAGLATTMAVLILTRSAWSSALRPVPGSLVLETQSN